MNDADRSICPFCAMGCSLLLRPGAGGAYHGDTSSPGLDYDTAGPFNRGSLCAKGNMALELVTHPRRLDVPVIRLDGPPRPVSWEAALTETVERLQALRERSGGMSIGIVAGSHLTSEEACLAADLAHALGTPHVDLCEPEDRALLVGIERSPGRPQPVQSVAQVDRMSATLVIGDLFTVAPCMAKPVLNARYARRQNLQGVLAAARHGTGWFGKPMMLCQPGQEVAALALLLSLLLDQPPARELAWRNEAEEVFARVRTEDLEAMSGLAAHALVDFVVRLRAEPETGVFLCSSFGGTERADLASALAAMLAEATGSRFLAMPVGANAMGVRRALVESGIPAEESLTTAEMFEASMTGELRALLALGCDPIASYPGRMAEQALANLDLLVAASGMPGDTTAAAHVVLPTSVWGEKQGTARNAFGADQALRGVLQPPGAARTDAAVLEDLCARLTALPVSRKRGPHAGLPAPPFFDDLEFFFRVERREHQAIEAGTHLMLPRDLPSESGDGTLTRDLSWARYERREPFVSLSPAHAAALGIASDGRIRLRSREGALVLAARIEDRVPEGVVLAPPHCRGIRRLMRWRLDPALHDIDARPTRVVVEALPEVQDA